MKAIILAAGQGNRLKKYTQDLPKGMLSFAGMTLIERQIKMYRRLGVHDLVIVRGFAAEKINYPGIKYVDNTSYERTNMVFSLFCAEDELCGDDIVVSYADVVFEERLLKNLMMSRFSITASVDTQWRQYWFKRYGSDQVDTEGLVLGENGSILELGRVDAPNEGIDARIIGLYKFDSVGIKKIKAIWQNENQKAVNFYMTDLLQAVIDSGGEVGASLEQGGWLEFDTHEDYENALKWIADESIDKFYRMEE